MGTWIRRNRKLWSNACQNMVSFIRRAKFPRPIKVLSRPYNYVWKYRWNIIQDKP